MTQSNRAITVDLLKIVLPFAGVLVAITFAWATLIVRVDSIVNEQSDQKVRLARMEEKVNNITEDLVRVKTLVEHTEGKVVVNPAPLFDDFVYVAFRR